MPPHIHYNTALGGVLVDPFAANGGTPLWRGEDGLPAPSRASDDDSAQARQFEPTRFDAAAVDRLLDDLRADDRRLALGRERDVALRAWGLVIESITYPTRFASPEAGRMVFDDCPRRTLLDLPVHREQADGIVFADDVGLR